MREFNINRCILHPSPSIQLKDNFTDHHWIHQDYLHFMTYSSKLVMWHIYKHKKHEDIKPFTGEHH